MSKSGLQSNLFDSDVNSMTDNLIDIVDGSIITQPLLSPLEIATFILLAIALTALLLYFYFRPEAQATRQINKRLKQLESGLLNCREFAHQLQSLSLSEAQKDQLEHLRFAKKEPSQQQLKQFLLRLKS